MNPTKKIARNPIRACQVAIFTMMACAAALVGPQTYASSCATEYDAIGAAYDAYVDAEDARKAAVASYRDATATRNPIAIWMAWNIWFFAHVGAEIAHAELLAAIDAFNACNGD